MRFKRAAVATATILLVAACSKSDTGDAAPAATETKSPSAPRAAPARIADICTLVTQEEAEATLGKKLAPPRRQASGDCWYMREGGNDFGDVEFILSIIPAYMGSEKEFDDFVADQTKRMNDGVKKSGVPGVMFTVEKAPGVGAPAYFIDPGLYVLKGQQILAVGLGGEKGVAIAKTALARMP